MRASLCLLTAVLLIAGSAHADDREEARKAFAEGQASDKAEDWQTAIEHYLHAYELVPHHFALYNIARDYERLGQLREAATWYARYVEAAPPSPDREKVQKLLGEIKLRPAKLTVKSTPPGARVTIDGQKVGVTPFSAPVRGGGHRVAVELEGQRDERDVTLEFGEPETVELELHGVAAKPNPVMRPPVASQGMLVVRGTPEGALITVDNMPAGTMPMSLPVSEGAHTVKVTSYGYSDYVTTAIVTRGNESALNVTMTKGGLGATPGSETPSKYMLGYMLGFGGGADLRGDGGIYAVELGYRIGPLDISVRIGKAIGYTSVDVLARYALLRTKITPFIGVGYSYVKDGSSDSSSTGPGFEAVGGLRYDIVRANNGAGVSLMGETGIRTYSGLSDDMGVSKSGIFIPFMAELQLVFGGTKR